MMDNQVFKAETERKDIRASRAKPADPEYPETLEKMVKRVSLVHLDCLVWVEILGFLTQELQGYQDHPVLKAKVDFLGLLGFLGWRAFLV